MFKALFEGPPKSKKWQFLAIFAENRGDQILAIFDFFEKQKKVSFYF